MDRGVWGPVARHFKTKSDCKTALSLRAGDVEGAASPGRGCSVWVGGKDSCGGEAARRTGTNLLSLFGRAGRRSLLHPAGRPLPVVTGWLTQPPKIKVAYAATQEEPLGAKEGRGERPRALPPPARQRAAQGGGCQGIALARGWKLSACTAGVDALSAAAPSDQRATCPHAASEAECLCKLRLCTSW